jgi:predicted nucleic acid-binding protein
LDSAVFIYAIGVDHPYRAPCRALVTAMRSGDLVGEASVLAVQEVMQRSTPAHILFLETINGTR